MLKFRLILLRVVLIGAVFVSALSLNRFVFSKSSETGRFESSHLIGPAPIVVTTMMVGQARDVFQKVNYQRKTKRLKPLVWDEDLAKMAAAYSKQMAEDDFFSHYDNKGKTIAERAEDFKIGKWKKLGENLFKSEGYVDPVDIAVDGWLKSKPHKKNIFDPGWTHTGIGVYSKGEKTFITQEFVKK